jgi:hypothetical protein
MAVSATTVLIAVAAGVVITVRLPADFFTRPRREHHGRHRILQNAAGILLAVIGIVLSLPLVPGPGIILIVVGVAMTTFPGKHRLEQWLVRRKWVHRPVDRVRRMFDREPLQIPPHS